MDCCPELTFIGLDLLAVFSEVVSGEEMSKAQKVSKKIDKPNQEAKDIQKSHPHLQER